jgi:hypothetical protein
MSWYRAEPRRGQFNFSRWERLLAAASPVVTPLWIVDAGNTLYTGLDDNMSLPANTTVFKAFARFVTAAVHHFRGRGVIWELLNEPQGLPASAYAELATLVGGSLATAGLLDNETLIGPALAGPCAAGTPSNTCMNASRTYGWLEEVLGRGVLRYFSGVSVHPYRSNNPETLLPDYARLSQMIRRHTAPGQRVVPLLSSELGYSTCTPWNAVNCSDAGAPGNLTLIEQAEMPEPALHGRRYGWSESEHLVRVDYGARDTRRRPLHRVQPPGRLRPLQSW